MYTQTFAASQLKTLSSAQVQLMPVVLAPIPTISHPQGLNTPDKVPQATSIGELQGYL